MKKNKYNPITDKIAGKLSEIVGCNNLIYKDYEKLEPFSKDEVLDEKYTHMPDIVIKPRTTEEISKIVILANRENIPITPRGAGSGLSGGAVPLFGGIVISLERMNNILELDKENMMITVEPGVISNDINEYLKEYGFVLRRLSYEYGNLLYRRKCCRKCRRWKSCQIRCYIKICTGTGSCNA